MKHALHTIFQLMQQNSLTNYALEQALKLPSSTVSRWKDNKGKPSYLVLIKLADYFGVSIDHLVGREKPEAPALGPDEQKLLDDYRAASDTVKGFIQADVQKYKDLQRSSAGSQSTQRRRVGGRS